jgi:hypothetical protein
MTQRRCESVRQSLALRKDQMQDLHQALKFEPQAKGRASKAGVDFVVVRGQSGKDDAAFGLHAAPNQFTTSGMQSTDFMSLLGFVGSGCQFVDKRECFSRVVPGDFDLASFLARFDGAFEELKHAERHLKACGFFLDQVEGWGILRGKAIQRASKAIVQ